MENKKLFVITKRYFFTENNEHFSLLPKVYLLSWRTRNFSLLPKKKFFSGKTTNFLQHVNWTKPCVTMDDDIAIHTYFSLGYSHAEILECLASQNIVMGMRTLRSKLKNLNLHRQKTSLTSLSCTFYFLRIARIWSAAWLHVDAS